MNNNRYNSKHAAVLYMRISAPWGPLFDLVGLNVLQKRLVILNIFFL